MNARDGHRVSRRDIEDILGTEVLTHTYDTYDTAAARDRIARALVGAALPGQRAGTGRASPLLERRERAAVDLRLASALVLNAGRAAEALAWLADTQRVDADGALVFACLLYLTGRQEAAQFWWQFAGGAGNRTAANCLDLYHRSHGRAVEAEHWRRQGRILADLASPEVPATPIDCEDRPLLAAHIRHGLIAACRRGDDPRLPPAVDGVLRGLAVEADDDDFGTVPRPTKALPADLARLPASRAR
ncbi:hypothetical protein [Embleya sp. NBC_00896]|uniref:hypothetical protein n=1 Tax=Embleya sp. NBC_00896 TaxID=2975961 RepID=UPI002F91A9CC|nr:hypothetical protein OG928_47700 [Embleya sp. NBC_00896]